MEKPVISVCSLFRDSQIWHGHSINQVGRFFKQMVIGDLVPDYFFCVEGNSKDTTRKALEYYKDNLDGITILNQEVSGSEVASIADQTRFRNLSACGNLALNTAKCSDADLILWVESDIVLPENFVYEMVESFKLAKATYGSSVLAVAPVAMQGNEHFYDTLCFTELGGRKFSNHDLPYFQRYAERYMEMESIGTCAIMDADLLREHDIDFGDNCFMELCRKARSCNLRLFCDTEIGISHPAQNWVAGRLI